MAVRSTEAENVLKAVRDIVPTLRANGLESEDQRWIVQENIDLLEKAGAFRIAVPKRFGGLDLTLKEQVEILTEISRGCGSTGWVAVAWISSAWMATLYPLEAQEEIFKGGSVRISGGFTPTAKIVATEGGYRLNGSWRFNSGVRGAHWDLLAAELEHADGSVEEVYAMVPVEELTIADDWHVSAAIATGSSTSTATDVFVPAHRVITLEAAVLGTSGGGAVSGSRGRDYSLISFVVAESVAAYIGMARAAYEDIVATVKGKPLAYSNVTDQAQHPLTQIQIALAHGKIEAAEALAETYLTVLQERADAGEQPTLDEKAEVRGKAGVAILLTQEALEALHSISGAGSLSRKAHFQRFYRDLQGLARHGLMAPNMSLEVYGRTLLGLDPDSLFL
ncbi:acyl-CoA dehydrogenase [Streptomyces sp. HUCO-GS316]|uniref:acyl-CoA dehydrogenase family protein n=1 Tax=Streptomyces sp. HUCO-GS316 TaxID=2692198 RepID=UPI0013715664|nr:acyl-CoA dehydrogenase family protein [Streptomyces sp. HUCO-GS316]MXM65850.1 acyl-CoA dehydrogenase [Streptomyces sp. HUCO-GS316]